MTVLFTSILSSLWESNWPFCCCCVCPSPQTQKRRPVYACDAGAKPISRVTLDSSVYPTSRVFQNSMAVHIAIEPQHSLFSSIVRQFNFWTSTVLCRCNQWTIAGRCEDNAGRWSLSLTSLGCGIFIVCMQIFYFSFFLVFVFNRFLFFRLSFISVFIIFWPF